MEELSLHILDIIQNSLQAGATRISLAIIEDSNNDSILFSIRDNGAGMSLQMCKEVFNPFITTRKNRNVGLGLPLLSMQAKLCDGDVEIRSEPGIGTIVRYYSRRSHIDRAPLGDLAGTLSCIISLNEDIRLHFAHRVNNKRLVFSTQSLKHYLGDGIRLADPRVNRFIYNFLSEQINKLYQREESEHEAE
jgi:hypothetical protein